MRAIAALVLMTQMVWAGDDKAGEFDYYVMALSWSPNWCATEGAGAEQCDRDLGWSLHGLWPQYEKGWPSACQTAERDPTRAMTGAMADIMGSGGLAWHQWKKHGRCSGLSATDYFALSREAYESVTRPAVFRQLEKPIKLPAAVVEEAWLKENPRLGADMLTVKCKNGAIQEVRICLTKGLVPRACGVDTVRDCQMPDARFEPIN